MKTTNSRFAQLIAGSFLLASCLASCQKEDSGVQPANKVKPALENPNDLTQATPQTNLKGLIILMDFSDAPANVTVSRANNLINGVGYTEPAATGSLRDYWYRQSRGKISLTHEVQGYFRAPHPAQWYKDRKNWTDYVELSRQALAWFKTQNPNYDWNSFSLSTDPSDAGTFLSMNFFSTAWIPGSGGTHSLFDFTAPNGKKTGQITAQTFISPWDKDVNLFWITHEQGHSVWSSPDTYDHNGKASGTGHYSVMSGNQGNGQIESFGAPFLVKQGWVKVVDIKPNQTYTLTQDGNTVARYVNPADPKEYFLVEARKKTTLGNEMVPNDRGLLIWHVDENVTTGNDDPGMTPTQHYAWAIEQADGKFDLEKGVNQKDGGDYFVAGNVFSSNSTPNSKWWNETASNLNLSNIKMLPNNKISFCNGTCAVSYCAAGSISAEYEFIQRVQFGSIDNSSGAAGYSNFSAKSTQVSKGSTKPITVTIGIPYPADKVLVWCDWNKDGVFDPATEQSVLATSASAPNLYTGTINVPSNAATGQVGMRIRMVDTANLPNNNTPCGNAGYGEVEDYTLNTN